MKHDRHQCTCVNTLNVMVRNVDDCNRNRITDISLGTEIDNDLYSLHWPCVNQFGIPSPFAVAEHSEQPYASNPFNQQFVTQCIQTHPWSHADIYLLIFFAWWCLPLYWLRHNLCHHNHLTILLWNIRLIMKSIRRYNCSELLLFSNHVGYHPRLGSRVVISNRFSNPSGGSFHLVYHAVQKFMLLTMISIPSLPSINFRSLFTKILHLPSYSNHQFMFTLVKSGYNNGEWTRQMRLHLCRSTSSNYQQDIFHIQCIFEII